MLINTIQRHLANRIENNELTNDEIVQLIEQLGSYLNLQTISTYAKNNKISYNGVKKYRNIITIFKTKFVIDNA